MSTDTEDTAGQTPDDYWASEPVANEAVAEWWEQQPERRQGGEVR